MHPSAETMIASLIFGNSLNLSNPWFWNISTAASAAAAAGLLDLSSSRPTFSDCKRYQNVGFFVATISWWGEVMMGVWRDHQQGTTPQALVQAAAAVYCEMCPSVTPQSNTSTEIIFNTRLGLTISVNIWISWKSKQRKRRSVWSFILMAGCALYFGRLPLIHCFFVC